MMRKTLHQFFAVLLLVVAFAPFPVRGSGIAVTLVDFRLDTTQNVNLGYTLTISAQVKNTDTIQSFAGFLDFGLHNTTNNLTTADIFNKPPYSGNQITLSPGETVPAIFSIDIDLPYFAPGPDVVVVWPISLRPVTDSILIYLNIEGPTGIESGKKDDFAYTVLYDKILLSHSAIQMNFKQVRILNILGQQAAAFSADFINEIPIPDIPKGIYLCEMITADKKTRVIKFIHQ